MFNVLEAVKTIGSITGLLSVSLLAYDRVIRSRPIAFVSVEKYHVHLTIHNSVVETVIIDEIKIRPPIMKLRDADDMKSANEERAEVWYPTMVKEKPEKIFIVLKDKERRSFMLNRSADFENAKDDQKVHVRLKWHSTRKTFLIPRYVCVKARVGDLKGLRDAALVNKV